MKYVFELVLLVFLALSVAVSLAICATKVVWFLIAWLAAALIVELLAHSPFLLAPFLWAVRKWMGILGFLMRKAQLRQTVDAYLPDRPSRLMQETPLKASRRTTRRIASAIY